MIIFKILLLCLGIGLFLILFLAAIMFFVMRDEDKLE